MMWEVTSWSSCRTLVLTLLLLFLELHGIGTLSLACWMSDEEDLTRGSGLWDEASLHFRGIVKVFLPEKPHFSLYVSCRMKFLGSNCGLLEYNTEGAATHARPAHENSSCAELPRPSLVVHSPRDARRRPGMSTGNPLFTIAYNPNPTQHTSPSPAQ